VHLIGGIGCGNNEHGTLAKVTERKAMQPMDLYRILHQEPFQPLRVHLTDGRSYDIHDPYQAVVGKTYFHIGIPAPDLPEGIYDHIEYLEPADVVRVDPLETKAPPADT
jgi:hypothetical protein